jgi:excisionase family DNA binding protein
MEKLLLTPEEAAQALGIGRSKLYRLLAQGSLESVKLGGSRRVSPEALREFVTWLYGIGDQGQVRGLSDGAPCVNVDAECRAKHLREESVMLANSDERRTGWTQ